MGVRHDWGDMTWAPLAPANPFKTGPSAAEDGGGRRFFNRLGASAPEAPRCIRPCLKHLITHFAQCHRVSFSQ